MSLTPAEQQFFETGELTPELTPEPPNPLDLAALSKDGLPPEPIVEPLAAPAPPPEPQPLDATEILRRSLAEAQVRSGQLEAELQRLQAPTPAPPPALPDPNVDPLGNMMGQLEAVNKVVTELQKSLVEQQTQNQQLQQFQAFQQQVRVLKDQFAATTPDFDTAYQHLRNARIADLRAFGLPDPQIHQAIFREEAVLSEAAIRNGKNPAAEIYEMAKRHGYTLTPQQQQQARSTIAPDAKLASIQAAQKAALNLPKTTKPEEFTVEGLKELGDADLNKAVLDDKLWAKIVGGDSYPL